MNVITVTQLNTYIKSIIDDNILLNKIFVVGEISNFKHYYQSGHIYLTLKDDSSQLRGVMFSSYALRLKFKPENGMRVVCRGRISVYERDGQYQLYIEDMQPDGIGALSLAYEQLKEKLLKEGLFDNEHKKSLPKMPKRIGVATSNMGAAIEDIKNITKRRYPLAELVIAPTVVQGEQAPEDIVKSIELLDSMDDIDVIIVGRGGGSIEDLWGFNAECVARAVYNCKTPIVSAVGHETDFTICDFVADVRAETPSAAAEMVVPDINALNDFVSSARSRMTYALNNIIEREYQRFDYIYNESILANYTEYFEDKKDILDSLNDELNESFNSLLKDKETNLSNIANSLNMISPLAVLSRGFSAVSVDDKLIKSVKDIKKDSKVKLTFNDGSALCTVDEVSINE